MIGTPRGASHRWTLFKAGDYIDECAGINARNVVPVSAAAANALLASTTKSRVGPSCAHRLLDWPSLAGSLGRCVLPRCVFYGTDFGQSRDTKATSASSRPSPHKSGRCRRTSGFADWCRTRFAVSRTQQSIHHRRECIPAATSGVGVALAGNHNHNASELAQPRIQPKPPTPPASQ